MWTIPVLNRSVSALGAATSCPAGMSYSPSGLAQFFHDHLLDLIIWPHCLHPDQFPIIMLFEKFHPAECHVMRLL
jgi:hypothetical protein